MGAFEIEPLRRTEPTAVGVTKKSWPDRALDKGHVLVVENEKYLRESLGQLLREHGFFVAFADNGREALSLLRAESLPDLIVLDLKMPVMDGWEFRAIQKDDPKLGLIPVLVVSADASAKATSISAQGYLRKPFDSKDVLEAVERVLAEDEVRMAARLTETERLASLGRLAANVGHEINNPLTFVMLNLRQSLQELRSSLRAFELAPNGPLPAAEVVKLKEHIVSVAAMLQECELGAERIRGTITNLQQLSQKTVENRGPLDILALIDESVSMASNQIHHRARLSKSYGKAAVVRGNRAALGQVFLNLLVNAAQSIPEGHADENEIVITTQLETTEDATAIRIEIRDSGTGMAPDVVSRIFEPYFTTKASGEGVGLGLSISRQTISDHGGRLTVESEAGKGTVFRILLPLARAFAPSFSVAPPLATATLPRGRVLVIDDEPLIGRIILKALKPEHDVVVVERAADALALLEQGEVFDTVICDLVMPDLSGPECYARIAERWPSLAAQMVFMTGGAFTPRTIEFLKKVPTAILDKPFAIDDLCRMVRERVRRPS